MYKRQASPLAVGPATSGADDSGGVTGGVYKARERIHRGMLILSLIHIFRHLRLGKWVVQAKPIELGAIVIPQRKILLSHGGGVLGVRALLYERLSLIHI